ncbi:MAG: hypothetical protein KKA68_21270 [Gammaproteobacteria bacterium]|nr:hypothetical protein [Gammaproteobacteria bacterium]
MDEALLRPGVPRHEGSGDRLGTEEDGGADESSDAERTAQEVEGSSGDSPDQVCRPKRYSLTDFAKALALALRETEKAGDNKFHARAAAILGISVRAVEFRIANNEQLKAIYGMGQTLEPKTGLSAGEVMNRKPQGGLVQINSDPSTVDLVEIVSDCDRQLHELGLKKMGLSETLINRVRKLDGLAANTGKFLSISLEKLSRSYYVQVLELMEIAQENRRRIMIPEGQPGHLSDAQEVTWANKIYIEQVKEAGRAYELFLHGAQAMVEMMIKVEKSGKAPAGQRAKPGWGIVDAPSSREPMPS